MIAMPVQKEGQERNLFQIFGFIHGTLKPWICTNRGNGSL